MANRKTPHRLITQIEKLDVEAFSGDQEMVDRLKQLMTLIQSKLEEALVLGPKEIGLTESG